MSLEFILFGILVLLFILYMLNAIDDIENQQRQLILQRKEELEELVRTCNENHRKYHKDELESFIILNNLKKD